MEQQEVKKASDLACAGFVEVLYEHNPATTNTVLLQPKHAIYKVFSPQHIQARYPTPIYNYYDKP